MADPRRVLVTGGAGFIGSHVVDALITRGYEVAVVDLLTTGNRKNVHPEAAFHLVDIRDAAAVSQVMADFQPAIVDHHAAQISVTLSAKDPVMDAEANVVGSLVVLEACRANGIEHVVFASTGGALYGEPERLPAAEDAVVAPLSPYGAAKASVETYLRMYEATWGLSYAALRYANVYGPRQIPEGEAGVVAIFTDRMLRGERPVVFGDGEQQRDFVYVGDVARANVLAIERSLQGPYNVGTSAATSVNRIVAALAERCGYDGDANHAPERPGEVRRVTLDATRIGQAAGWRPDVSLEEGLTLTVEDAKARLGTRG